MIVIAALCSIVLGAFALPFGLLPSVFAFRGLANGLDASAGRKRAYAATVWSGLAAAWLIGAFVVFAAATVLGLAA